MNSKLRCFTTMRFVLRKYPPNCRGLSLQDHIVIINGRFSYIITRCTDAIYAILHFRVAHNGQNLTRGRGRLELIRI